MRCIGVADDLDTISAFTIIGSGATSVACVYCRCTLPLELLRVYDDIGDRISREYNEDLFLLSSKMAASRSVLLSLLSEEEIMTAAELEIPISESSRGFAVLLMVILLLLLP